MNLNDLFQLIERFTDGFHIWLLLAAAVLSGVAFHMLLTKYRQRRHGYLSLKQGARGERKAAKILKRMGYRVIKHEPVFQISLLVDGATRHHSITPDLLVCKAGQNFVVEVKNRASISSVDQALIRRQVLEYLLASDLPCLLVDVTSNSVTEIHLHPDYYASGE